MSEITQHLQVVNETLEDSKCRESARLVAVSKTVTANEIQIAYDYGQRLFGENRIESLQSKTPVLPADIEWHFIGNLQSRQLRKIVTHSSWIHSVDDVSKINKIDNICIDLDKSVKFLIQINISGEDSKSGFTTTTAYEAIERALECKKAEFVGFMTMAPFTASEDELHHCFSQLEAFRVSCEKKYGVSLPELSMGMSNDYPIALEEGATMIRVGSSIFK